MNCDLLGDSGRRARGKSLSDKDGGCRHNDCVIDCHGFFGSCGRNSDRRILWAEVCWNTRTASEQIIVG